MIDIKELEDEINEIFYIEYFEEGIKANLKINEDGNLLLTVNIYDVEDMENALDIFYEAICENPYNLEKEEIMNKFIDNIYRKYDKDKKMLKSYKRKIDIKLGQLNGAVITNDENKIRKINADLINLYKMKIEAKYNYHECKEIVHVLYLVIDEFNNEEDMIND